MSGLNARAFTLKTFLTGTQYCSIVFSKDLCTVYLSFVVVFSSAYVGLTFLSISHEAKLKMKLRNKTRSEVAS